jgi:hypothetical protein
MRSIRMRLARTKAEAVVGLGRKSRKLSSPFDIIL